MNRNQFVRVNTHCQHLHRIGAQGLPQKIQSLIFFKATETFGLVGLDGSAGACFACKAKTQPTRPVDGRGRHPESAPISCKSIHEAIGRRVASVTRLRKHARERREHHKEVEGQSERCLMQMPSASYLRSEDRVKTVR